MWLASKSQLSSAFASQMLRLQELATVPLSFRNLYMLREEQYTHGNCLLGTWKSGDNLECEPLRALHLFVETGSIIDRLSNSPGTFLSAFLNTQITSTCFVCGWGCTLVQVLTWEAVSPWDFNLLFEIRSLIGLNLADAYLHMGGCQSSGAFHLLFEIVSDWPESCHVGQTT